MSRARRHLLCTSDRWQTGHAPWAGRGACSGWRGSSWRCLLNLATKAPKSARGRASSRRCGPHGPRARRAARRPRRLGSDRRSPARPRARVARTGGAAAHARGSEGLGVSERLVERGNDAVQLQMHFGKKLVRTRLFDAGLEDTAYPFLLFISQAETEAVLNEHLAARGVHVERGASGRRLIPRPVEPRACLGPRGAAPHRAALPR
jgi:hypothetical protein